jgi:hypothetical protein
VATHSVSSQLVPSTLHEQRPPSTTDDAGRTPILHSWMTRSNPQASVEHGLDGGLEAAGAAFVSGALSVGAGAPEIVDAGGSGEGPGPPAVHATTRQLARRRAARARFTPRA